MEKTKQEERDEAARKAEAFYKSEEGLRAIAIGMLRWRRTYDYELAAIRKDIAAAREKTAAAREKTVTVCRSLILSRLERCLTNDEFQIVQKKIAEIGDPDLLEQLYTSMKSDEVTSFEKFGAMVANLQKQTDSCPPADLEKSSS